MVQLILTRTNNKVPHIRERVKFIRQLTESNDFRGKKLSMWDCIMLAIYISLGRIVVLSTVENIKRVSKKYFDFAEKAYFYDLDANIISLKLPINLDNFSQRGCIYYRIFDARTNKDRSVLEARVYVAKSKGATL